MKHVGLEPIAAGVEAHRPSITSLLLCCIECNDWNSRSVYTGTTSVVSKHHIANVAAQALLLVYVVKDLRETIILSSCLVVVNAVVLCTSYLWHCTSTTHKACLVDVWGFRNNQGHTR